MADVKKMATRDGYGKALVELGKEHDNIVVLDADLAGSTKTGMFAKAYPDRHFNCGIAEGNMTSCVEPSRKQDTTIMRYLISPFPAMKPATIVPTGDMFLIQASAPVLIASWSEKPMAVRAADGTLRTLRDISKTLCLCRTEKH